MHSTGTKNEGKHIISPWIVLVLGSHNLDMGQTPQIYDMLYQGENPNQATWQPTMHDKTHYIG
jgi:hypothetical protein